ALEHFRRRLGEPRPHRLVALLEREALGIGAVAEDDRIAPAVRRAENIGAQDEPVVHADGRIPFNVHLHTTAVGHERIFESLVTFVRRYEFPLFAVDDTTDVAGVWRVWLAYGILGNA